MKLHTYGTMPKTHHGLGSGWKLRRKQKPRGVATVVDAIRQDGAEGPIVRRTETLTEAGERGMQRPVSLAPVAATGTFLRSLTSALRAHDEATGEHADRTRSLAVRVALELGLEDVSRVCHAAVLHDIGKLCIPHSILHKPGRLSEAEWRVVRRHPVVGADLLMGVADSKPVRRAILAHHERFDGRGYPFGLAGTEIPIEARLICVVDAYDAMTSERPYRGAMSHAEAIAQLKLETGTQFDPAVMEAFEGALD